MDKKVGIHPLQAQFYFQSVEEGWLERFSNATKLRLPSRQQVSYTPKFLQYKKKCLWNSFEKKVRSITANFFCGSVVRCILFLLLSTHFLMNMHYKIEITNMSSKLILFPNYIFVICSSIQLYLLQLIQLITN